MSRPRPYYEHGEVTIYHGDAREVLPTLAPASVSLVLTDPPYNVGKRYDLHDDARPADDYAHWLQGILHAAARVTTDGLVYFPGLVNLFTAPLVLRGSALRIVRTLGWHRKEFAGDLWTSGPAMSWEPVIWASRQPRPYFHKRFGPGGRDFLVVPATHGDPFRRGHPCPKPLPVMAWLVDLFCPPGETLLDPFMGTGSSLRAAKDAGCPAIGIEVSERYCEIAARRLAQEVLW